MPLCPQITNTPITVVLNADFTVTSVVPVFPADTEQLAEVATDATTALDTANDAIADATTALANANTAIANAATANAAATAAAFSAGVAQNTANGKAKVNYSTSGPSGAASNGDLWFQVNGSGSVIAQFVYNNGYIAAPITNTVIANLDAGKITAGTISGIAYNNGSGTFSVSPSGNLVASSAIITGQITATSGTFTGAVFASSGTFTGTVTATSGSFTGTITSSNGNIAGFILASGSLSNAAADTFLFSNPGSDGLAFSTVGRSIMRRLQLNGSSGTTLGTATLAVGGNTAIDGTTISIGNVTAQSSLINSGIAIQNGTAVHILTGGRFVQSTSSERFKKNIETIPQGGWLEKVLQIRPVNFQYDEAYCEAPDEVISGLIAEDIAEIPGFEHLIYNDPLGDPFSISYERLTVFLTLAIKELKAEIDTLKGE